MLVSKIEPPAFPVGNFSGNVYVYSFQSSTMHGTSHKVCVLWWCDGVVFVCWWGGVVVWWCCDGVLAQTYFILR